MIYQEIRKGIFLNRPNRFIAHVKIPMATGVDQEVLCHVKNTGRCRELLLPGVTVLVQYHPEASALGRKTEYSLIGVYKDRKEEGKPELLINMDSQAPNAAAYQWLKAAPPSWGIDNIRREVTYGQSRFDLAFELCSKKQQVLMEVKGVTLESGGIAAFPDAPTDRGLKHVHELIRGTKEGYTTAVLFVIQMKEITEFRPNWSTHPQFGEALKEAAAAGVHILAYDCLITENSMTIDSPVRVNLRP